MAAKKQQSSAALPADLTFEKALAELEEITEKLEDGKESLEESMKLYEHGLLLKDFCEQKLKEAEGKWLMLKKQKDGSVAAEEVPNDKIPEQNELQGQMF
ncbi:MAG: exodeoxyribonuclease VII small subunit [Spirochaetes bacterium]|nr:exodeoxyribonuclease VII small subunit [Spirochaetota bacterium]MBX3721266.1 exodeoxyribonuclease VII small subunit [Turneriella sp.]